jgi:predicted nucleic acid-binding Zn ribbon protein
MARAFNDKTLKQVIAEMLRASGMEKRYTELDIEEHYRQLVGEYISRKTREVKLREKTLVLRIESGPIKEEISYQKSRILASINEHFGKVIVEDVQILG